jgi:hypothetical protein
MGQYMTTPGGQSPKEVTELRNRGSSRSQPDISVSAQAIEIPSEAMEIGRASFHPTQKRQLVWIEK